MNRTKEPSPSQYLFELPSQLMQGETTVSGTTPGNLLPDLSRYIPIPPYRDNGCPEYFLSNDEPTRDCLQELALRQHTEEYQATPTRVAVIIGEGSLATNLAQYPEENILLIDNSPEMVRFMGVYVEGLKNAENRLEWVESLRHAVGDDSIFRVYLEQYRETWGSCDISTIPLFDDEAFLAAKQIANKKVIQPWYVDVCNKYTMEHLGGTLRQAGARITFMNLTNLLPCIGRRNAIKTVGNMIGQLPVTPSAPILTTTATQYNRDVNPMGRPGYSWGNHITGPFFGLKNLQRGVEEGTVCDRRHLYNDTPDRSPDLDDFDKLVMMLFQNGLIH